MTIEQGLGTSAADNMQLRRGTAAHHVEGMDRASSRAVQVPVTVGGVVAIVVGLTAFRGLSSPDIHVQGTAAIAALVTTAVLAAAVVVVVALCIPRFLRHRTLTRAFPDAILVTGQWDPMSYRAATGDPRAVSRGTWTLSVTDEGAELWEGGLEPRRIAAWPTEYVARVVASPAKHSLQNAAVLAFEVDGRSIPLRPLKSHRSLTQWMDTANVVATAQSIRDRLNRAR